MTTDGYELQIPEQSGVPEAEEPRLPLYEVAQVLELLHELTPGHKLADSVTSLTVDFDPVVIRLLDAYEVLRGETAVAQRDRKMIDLLLQGKKPAEVVETLDPTDLMGRKGQPLLDPKQTVVTVRKELWGYFNRSNIYRPENVAIMLARYMSSQDAVDSIPLPSAKSQRSLSSIARPIEVSSDQKDQVEHWLTKGLAERLTTEQIQDLGGYMLGATLADAGRVVAARGHIETLTDIIEVAKTQTEEFAAGRYRTREFQKLLVFNPDKAAALVDMIAKAKKEGGPVFNASPSAHAASYNDALKRIADERAKIIQALRHVVVLASADPPRPSGEE